MAGAIRRSDFSPVVHPDTAFEEALVQECLHENACTTLGGGASFSGIYHMVGWLNFMTVAEWLGLGRDAIHLLIQFLNASRVVVIMLVADRLGGPTAAALAPYFAFRTGASPGALYDSALMAFFGTVLLVQCVAAAVARPPLKLVVLAALGAAVIAEVHLAGLLAFLSVVWVVLLYAPDRVRRVAVVTMAFAAAVLIISPRGLVWDLAQLFSRLGGVSSGSTQSGDAFPLRLEIAKSALYFLLPWIMFRLLRSWVGEPPRGLQGALAVCVPLFVAYSIGVLLGVLPPTSLHYLEHGWPARAVVLAVPIAAIASAVWDGLTSRVAVSASPYRAVLWIMPLLLSLNAAVAQPGPERPQPRWADVQALARLLHDDWHWDWPTVNRQLLSPEKQRVLADLSAAVPGWESDDGMAARRDPEPLALIAVETPRVAHPLPRGWIIVSRRTFYSLLAIPTQSSLHWDDQTACLEDQSGHETCFGPPVDPNLLWTLQSRVPEIRRFVRRVPWRGTAGTEERIVMPELPLTCVGRILRGPPGIEIDPTGRSARVTNPGEVIFEWIPNTPDCGMWDFLKQDDPPFVIAGSPETVDLMSRLMSRERP